MNKKTAKKDIKDQEDIELILAFIADDISAFDGLVIKYKDLVFNLCFRILGNYDDANDCAQETFIKVYNNIKNFKFHSEFSTWLYRIAVNTCKNNLSSSKNRLNRKILSLDSPSNTSYETSNSSGRQNKIEVRDFSMNPARILEQKENEKIIQNAIDSLSTKLKILVVLRDIEGKSYDEIVKITGLKLGTVKSKLARARQQLRGMLRGVI